MRLRWWLLVMDVLAALGAWGSGGGWRWRAYLWALGRASDATDWGQGAAGEPWDVEEASHG